jgi:hypothetical protein
LVAVVNRFGVSKLSIWVTHVMSMSHLNADLGHLVLDVGRFLMMDQPYFVLPMCPNLPTNAGPV